MTFSAVTSGNAAWGFRTGQEAESQGCSELPWVGHRDVLPFHPFSLLSQVLTGLPGWDLVIKVFGICIYLNLAFIKRHHKVPDCAITHLIPPEAGPKTSLDILD